MIPFLSYDPLWYDMGQKMLVHHVSVLQFIICQVCERLENTSDKKEDNLKNEDKLENEDNLKNEDDLRYSLFSILNKH